MPKTLATPKKTLDEVEKELRSAKHARKKFDLTLELCRYMRKDLHRMHSLGQSAVGLVEEHPELGTFRKARALWWVAYASRFLEQLDSAKSDFQHVLSILQDYIPEREGVVTQNEVDLFLIETLDNLAICHFHLGEYEEALKNFTEGLKFCELHRISGGLVSFNNSIGEIWKIANNQEKAFIHFNTALSISYAHNDLRRVAEILNSIASIHESYGEYNLALELLQKAHHHAIEYDNDYGIALTLLNKARILLHFNELNPAREAILTCVTIAQENQILMVELKAGACLAEVLIAEKQFAQAISQLQHTLQIATSIKEPNIIASLYLHIATCYQQLQDLHQAKSNAELALACTKQYNNTQRMVETFRLLSDIESSLGNMQASNSYLRQCIEAMELAQKEQNTKDIREAKMRLLLENAEREQEDLARKAAELEKSLEEKRGELSSMALALSQKNSVIEKLSARLSELSTASNESYTQKCSSMIREIETLKQSGEEQWSHLQKQFESIDPFFQFRLTERFPHLTQIETKICMLMRLNLSSKDIANILWISIRTVETHRYSVRKKLNLDTNTNLHHALHKI